MQKIMIPQELLGKYHQLQSREKKIRARREELRAKLVDLWEKGARTEPGNFNIRVNALKSVRLSWPRVSQVLDEDTCERLREQIPPTTTTNVSVFEKVKAKNKWPNKTSVT